MVSQDKPQSKPQERDKEKIKQKVRQKQREVEQKELKQKELEQKEEQKEEQKISALKKLIDEKDSEIAELTEHLKRLQAEFENYKKRVEKEKQQLKHIMLADFLRKLLPIIDSFELSMKSIKGIKNKNNNVEDVKKGFELIYAQFHDLLDDFGVQEIKTLGEKFDHTYHEALIIEETDDKEKDNLIIEELQKGFVLKNKSKGGESKDYGNDIVVLRTAKVKVLRFKEKIRENEGLEKKGS